MSLWWPCPWGTSTSWSPGYTAQCHLCHFLSHSPPPGNCPSLLLSVTKVPPTPPWPRASRPLSFPQPLPLSHSPRDWWSWDSFWSLPLLSKTSNCFSHVLQNKVQTPRLCTRPQAPFQILSPPLFFSSLCSSSTPSPALPQIVQNAKPLFPAQVDTSTWSGRPCIFTNKLKVSFRS